MVEEKETPRQAKSILKEYNPVPPCPIMTEEHGAWTRGRGENEHLSNSGGKYTVTWYY